jgi:hypothetical protein
MLCLTFGTWAIGLCICFKGKHSHILVLKSQFGHSKAVIGIELKVIRGHIENANKLFMAFNT